MAGEPKMAMLHNPDFERRNNRTMIPRTEFLKRVAEAVGPTYIADNFGKYTKREELARFMARYDLFRQILDIKGSIIECGVRSGSGLFQWFQISNILEPNAHLRVVYGFDTFEGFPKSAISDFELGAKPGGMSDYCYEDLLTASDYIYFYNCVFMPENKQVSVKYPWDRLTLVKGDFMQTGPQFLELNKHVIVSLLFLDFDIYAPTKKALQLFLPRMPKGSIIAFDELNNHVWPGETMALMEEIGIRNVRIQKFPYEQNISYVVLE